jgi:tetratricopeptide (TPR) repeat protein
VALGLCDKYKWSLRVWRPRLASTLGVAYARSGESVIGLEMARQAVDDAAQMRLKYDQPLLLVRLGQASLIAGRVFDAQNCGEEATRIAQNRGAKGDEAWARFLIARACWVKDPQDLEKSARELESALGLARDCEARPLTAYCQTMLAAVLGRRGNHEADEIAAAADAAYKEPACAAPLDPVMSVSPASWGRGAPAGYASEWPTSCFCHGCSAAECAAEFISMNDHARSFDDYGRNAQGLQLARQ